jgi:hypothetical protein
MIVEASKSDVERLKTISQGEVNNLKEYKLLLEGIVETLEKDVLEMREKAKLFNRSGQKENYGHAMEKIHETILRIETCRKCVQECEQDLERKSLRIKEFEHFLAGK